MTEYSYRKRSMERKRRKQRRIIICVIAIAAILAITGLVLLIKGLLSGGKDDKGDNSDANNTVAEKEQGVIEDDIYIAGVAVGGMDYEQASQAVDSYVDSLLAKQLTIDVNGNLITATLDVVGLEAKTDEAISGAFALEDPGTIELVFDINAEKYTGFIESECKQYEVKPKNAKLKRSNGEFVIKRGKVGKLIDTEATKEAILGQINSSVINAGNINVVAVIYEEDPEYTSKDMAKCTDVLGKFSTEFKEYQADRSANVRNAASFIDGSVIYPGETFSVAEAIYPLSEDNGYKAAPSYASGQVVDSLGGGVCQVSTTLYNAILAAELEIVERANHSMVVTYVKPSMDAAIAGDYKDLKFSNNTDAPIYIQGAVYSGVITFTVYGHETRPAGRTVKYESVVVETIEPGKDVVTKDPEQPESYEKVTQEAHVGYVANLYKIVYENGLEVSREKINYSRYKAEPRYVTKGTKKEKDKNKDKNKDKAKATKEPSTDNTTNATAAPEAPVVTEAPVVPQDPVVTEAPVQTQPEEAPAV